MNTTGPAHPVRPLTRGMRRQILMGSVLVFAVGIPLFVGTSQTDRYFAWTINPPLLTAAFLGATYWASFVLGYSASRQPAWARARTGVYAPLLFTVATLVATFLHIDRFHLTEPNLVTRAITWLWVAIYVLVPVAILILLVGQLRTAGRDPERAAPLPQWMRAVLGFNATVFLILRLILFAAPREYSPVWPWQLTPLTARAIAAWLLALGVIALEVVWENDLASALPVMATSTVFGLLQFVAIARYPRDVEWGKPSSWVYVAFLAEMLVVSVYGWGLSRGVRSRLRTAEA